MEQQKIFQLNFSHIPYDSRAAQIPDKIYLIDNFNEKKGHNTEIMSFPVQMNMSMTLMCTAGEAELSINLKRYTLKAGMVASISPGSFFQWLTASNDMECASMVINRGFMPVGNFEVKQGMEAAMVIKEHPLFTPSYNEMEWLISIYKDMKKVLLRENFRFKEIVTKNYLGIIMCNVLDRILEHKETREEQKPSSRKEEIFMQFIAAVQKYYTVERNVAFYADKLCVSPKYLSAVIHEVSGKYATKWINEYVILECKAMLKAEGDSVKNVCNRLNFANQSFFAKYFKQHTGMTPKEYKNK